MKTEHMMIDDNGELALTFKGKLMLLGAFQTLEFTGRPPDGLGFAKWGGYNNKQACKIIEEITTINPRRGSRKKVCPTNIDPNKELMPQYMDWLFRTEKHRRQNGSADNR